MAASGKKSGTKAKPIEGEILSSEDSAGGSPKPDGVDYFRRFVWFVTGAAVIFIAGLMAAPTIQRQIDSLFGDSGSDAPVPAATEIFEAEPPQADRVMAEVVPEEILQEILQAAPQETLLETQAGIVIPEAEPTAEPAAEPEAAAEVMEEDAALIVSDIDGETITSEAIKELTDRLTALEARLAILETEPPKDSDNAGEERDNAAARRIAMLEARLSEIESSGATTFSGSGTDGLLLALSRLSRRLESGLAFSAEMLEFKTRFDAAPQPLRAGNEAPVATLQRHADGGVKTPARLRRDFAAALPTALEAAALAPDAGWWDKVWAGLKSMVVVRRTGQVEGASAEAVLARIEFHLAEDDIDGIAAALAEAQKLEPRVLEALGAWQADAADSLAARQAAAALIATLSAAQSNTAQSNRE